ncbi:MAG: hypothetical protein JO029_13610 [Candidatus Eremiobacteraeota bacterium]|nr:hypothetical protein [Candidatus Eremiobacteraeota bacterium]
MSDAHAAILAALAAMGGRERLENIHSVSATIVGTRTMVEQSERPTGPYFRDDFHLRESVDFDNGGVREAREDSAYAGDLWWTDQTEPYATQLVVRDGVAAYARGSDWQYAGGSPLAFARERTTFGPERVLLTALQARDLISLPDVDLNGSPFHRVAFTGGGAACTLTLNARTNLPWSIAWTTAYPYSVFYNAWGDVRTTLTFNAWSLEPNGVRYPREWTYERVNLPDQQLTVIGLTFNDLNAVDVSLPATFLAAHRTPPADLDGRPFPVKDAKALASGIELVPGSWNVAFVKQSDGVVMIEAPISSGYVRQALAYAAQRFALPVKAVITTSDSWPHIAGVREAVALGVPVYALDLNEPILNRLLTSPRTIHPDDLARTPRPAQLHWISHSTMLGDGDNGLQIVPYRTATGERQMMVYLPNRRLLYTSDLFAPDDVAGDGTVKSWFTPEYLDEAIGAIERERLSPETIWGMHYGPLPYQTIVDARAAFERRV